FLSHRHEKQFSRKNHSNASALIFFMIPFRMRFLMETKGPFPFASNSKPGWAFFFSPATPSPHQLGTPRTGIR
ncbi:hypothetical protein, partial [Bilophila wadsworthia]|uniref:hypothetical protein n=1 Tax=Bilophila wadsworthia TaxID=35833 RepID=UPI0026715ED6